MTNAPWLLEESTFDHVRNGAYEVAVIPLGATEPHNTHLPYGTDTFEAGVIGRAVCRKAHAEGARVVMLPVIPYGTETNMRQLPLAINVNPTTLYRLLQDVVDSVAQAGIHKIVLLNSHGGNDLKPFLREQYGRSDAHLFLCDWFRMVGDRYGEIFQHAEDHAGEMETSMGLAYFSELVVRDDSGRLHADEGAVRPTRFHAVNQKWVSLTRPWHLLTTQSGSGNPHAATKEKGRQVLDLVVERIAPFLVELSGATVDEQFPF